MNEADDLLALHRSRSSVRMPFTKKRLEGLKTRVLMTVFGQLTRFSRVLKPNLFKPWPLTWILLYCKLKSTTLIYNLAVLNWPATLDWNQQVKIVICFELLLDSRSSKPWISNWKVLRTEERDNLEEDATPERKQLTGRRLGNASPSNFLPQSLTCKNHW